MSKSKHHLPSHDKKDRSRDHDSDPSQVPQPDGDLAGLDLFTLIDQAQETKKALADSLTKMSQARERERQSHQQALAQAESDRDSARGALSALETAHQSLAAEVAGTAKSLRAMVATLTAIRDPLTPPLAEDNENEFSSAVEQLRGLIDRKSGHLDTPAGMIGILDQARDLCDLIGARIKVQTTRVKLLRAQSDELNTRHATIADERSALSTKAEGTAKQLAATQAQLAKTEAALTAARNDLANAAKAQAAAAAAAEQTQRELTTERDQLQGELDTARQHLADLKSQLGEAIEAGRNAARSCVELAETVHALASDDEAEVGELPAINLPREELKSLIDDANNALEELDTGSFPEDLHEDLVAATKVVTDILAKRRSAVVAEVVKGRTRSDELQDQLTEQSGELEGVRADLAERENELSRTKAQLETSGTEVTRLGSELGERQKALAEAHGQLARLQTELATLRSQVEAGRNLRGEYTRLSTELEAARAESDRSRAQAQEWLTAQQGLTRRLVELANGVEGAASLINTKGTGGRFSKLLQRLEDAANAPITEAVAAARTSTEVVDKLVARLDPVARELRTRSATLEDRSRTLADHERKLATLNRTLQERDQTIRTIKQQLDELQQTARKAAELEHKCGERDTAIGRLDADLRDTRQALREAQAMIDEIRAREAQTAQGLEEEAAELKRRLLDEQNARRDQEQQSLEVCEELETKTIALTAKADELERALEAREERIRALQSAVDEVAEERARRQEAEKRTTALEDDLAEAQHQIGELERELAAKASLAGLAEELDAARAERDQLTARLRVAEKALADERGSTASLKATVDALRTKHDDIRNATRNETQSLRERLDTTSEENRKLKDKIAGLDARVRTLTHID